MAKSQPHPMDRAMSNKWRTLRKVRKSSIRMSTTASVTDIMLSVLICWAFPTAITGPPVRCISMASWVDSTSPATSSSRAVRRALFSVSLDP